MPGAGEGHHAVDHATPARCQQDDRHYHAQALRPVRQGGVVQVVRAGPDIKGDQCPEVDDRQAIGIHRTLGLLRHEVVHHAQEAGGQEEAHGVVAVPPLHHRIGRARIDRVGLEPAHRDFQVVDDVQHRRHQDEGTEEPVTHIDVLGLALHDGAEEHGDVRHPYQGDQDVDRPFQFRVFLGAGEALRQRDDRQHDHGLPTPEGEGSETIGEQSRLAGALNHVVGRGEQCATTEGEDHRVGVQGTQTTEARPRQVEIERGPHQLRGDENTQAHPNDSPHHRHDGELANHLIVISSLTYCCAHARLPR